MMEAGLALQPRLQSSLISTCAGSISDESSTTRSSAAHARQLSDPHVKQKHSNTSARKKQEDVMSRHLLQAQSTSSSQSSHMHVISQSGTALLTTRSSFWDQLHKLVHSHSSFQYLDAATKSTLETTFTIAAMDYGDSATEFVGKL
jgi:hypothetical protein